MILGLGILAAIGLGVWALSGALPKDEPSPSGPSAPKGGGSSPAPAAPDATLQLAIDGVLTMVTDPAVLDQFADRLQGTYPDQAARLRKRAAELRKSPSPAMDLNLGGGAIDTLNLLLGGSASTEQDKKGLAVAVAHVIDSEGCKTPGAVIAVTAFQTAMGLDPDGKYGPVTRNALGKYVNPPPKSCY